MDNRDGIQDMTLEEVREAWRNGTPFDASHLCHPGPTIDNDQYDTYRDEWRNQLTALLATPVTADIPPGDTIIAVTQYDHLGPFMEQIEQAATPVTLAIQHLSHDHEHRFVLLRITPSDADPFEWIADDQFEGCEFAYDWTFERVANAALGVCLNAYWATEDEPAAWDLQVLYPLGHTLGSEHDYRVNVEVADPRKLVKPTD